MTKPTMQWKHSERTIARMLGATRIGNTGQSTPDAANDHLVVEVKHRRRAAVPKWMAAAVDKVRSQAGPQRLGLVVVHAAGQRYGEAIVLMRLQDFADWYVSPLAGASDEEIAVLAPDQLDTAQPGGTVSRETLADPADVGPRPANWGTSWDPIYGKR